MKNTTVSVSKKVALAAVGTASVAVVAAAGTAAADLVQEGLANSATIRVAEASACAPEQSGAASFAGCSSIL